MYKTEELFTLLSSWNPHMVLISQSDFSRHTLGICQSIRSQQGLENTLITFLPNKKDPRMETAAYQSGADAVIYQPVRPALFRSRIKSLLRVFRLNQPEVCQNLLKRGNLTIDRDNYLLIKAGQSMNLTAKERDLLVIVAQESGKVFSREQLANQVWDSNTHVNKRTIDVYINKLRDKAGAEYIKTMRGVGYKFVLPRADG